MRLTYVGPHDQVECLGRVVKRGDSADFTAAEAGAEASVTVGDDGVETHTPGHGLLAQADNWRPSGATFTAGDRAAIDKASVPELRAFAQTHGISLTGLSLKAEIADAVAEHLDKNGA